MIHPGRLRYYQKIFWPTGDLDLLMRVAFLPAAEARSCWELWKRQHDLDAITWEEHKVFARLAPRLAQLAPECPYRPRLEGLVKSHWTRCQLMLHASAKAIDVLAAHDIPVMLLKGGALQMNRSLQHGPRITSDLDILVPRRCFPQAITYLYRDGWRSNRSVEFLKLQWRFVPGLNLRFPPHGDVDVHHQPVHGPCLAPYVLDKLWQRSREDRFLGRAVRVPTAEDMLVFTAAHATHPEWLRQAGAAWVFDLASLLYRDELSLDAVVTCAKEFSAGPALLVALSYFHQLTGDARADELIKRLLAHGISHNEQWQFFLQTPTIRPRKVRRWWKQLRRLSGMEYEENVIPALKQVNAPVHSLAQVALSPVHELTCTRHELRLPVPPSDARSLVIEIAFEPPKLSRYKFEISMDGHALAMFTTSASRIHSAADFRACVKIPLRLASPLSARWEALAIESVNLKVVLPANATQQQLRDASPPGFRLYRAMWI